jgi:SpoIIAA-like
MITITNDTQNLVIAAVLGEFVLADFRELENATEHAVRFQGKANLLVDLRDMIGSTLDVAWEEIKFTRQHTQDFRKIAVVTNDQFLQWHAWLTRIFTDAEVQVFEDYDEALAWSQSE